MMSRAAGSAASPHSRGGVRLSRDELHVPPVAWPTLTVSLVAGALWLSILLYVNPSMLSCVVSSVCVYLLFTPMHDAAHGSLVKSSRAVNDVFGMWSALTFCGSFQAFRFVHLEHHKYTNDVEKDPDAWAGKGPAWLRPLRWSCQLEKYYYDYGRKLRQRPAMEACIVVVTQVGIYTALLYGIYVGNTVVLWHWAIPARVAMTFLVWTFDYVPHRPHQVTRSESMIKATSYISGLFKDNDIDVTPWLMYQNFHNIHHLYPTIPFYRMARVWWNHREELLRAGTPVTTVFPAT